MNWTKTWKLIKSDIIRKTLTDGKKLTLSSIIVSVLSPSAIAVLLFRLQHYFYKKNIYILAKLIAQINIILFAVEIGSGCQVEKGFIIGHANGIVIHDQVKIGKNCILMHQCSIGLKYKHKIPHYEQFMVLEEDVLVGAGARIMGPGVIGSGSKIGMNSVAIGSFPKRSVIAGVPGRVVRILNPEENFPPEVSGRVFKNLSRLTLAETAKRIHMDLKQRANIDGRPFSNLYYFKLFFSPPTLAVFIFRWASYFERASFRFIAKLLTTFSIVVLKTEIGPKAKIDGGLVIGHANGVLINNRVKIGKNAVFFHHNTVAIGPRAGLDAENDSVIIGDNFLCGSGARIIGNITLGDNTTVAMNAVVTRSAPDGALLSGIPARNMKEISKKKTENRDEESAPPPDGKAPTFFETINIIRQDIARRAKLEHKKAFLVYYMKMFLNPPAMAVILFRLAHYFEKKGHHLPAKILANINNTFYTVEIQASATIGPGLVLAHANGILIHEKSIIGKNCLLTLHNSISVGPKEGMDPEKDRTVIGDNAFIGMGARILGNIRLGNNVYIGANAVVIRSAPDGAVLTGIPAKQK